MCCRLLTVCVIFQLTLEWIKKVLGCHQRATASIFGVVVKSKTEIQRTLTPLLKQTS